jgi:hypothetical protein
MLTSIGVLEVRFGVQARRIVFRDTTPFARKRDSGAC